MFFQSGFDTRIVKKLLCGASVGALATVIAGSAHAQAQGQAASPDTESVTVTATGTSIKGIAPVGANLITVDAGAIKATGAVTTEEVLSQIPQLANTFNTQAVLRPSPSISAACGLRSAITRLRPSWAFPPPCCCWTGITWWASAAWRPRRTPASSPQSCCSAVDLLPDGASSIYGANAIAGVINFVTRETYQGFQANASVGVADGYSAFNASMMAGTDWGTGGAYLAFEHKDNTYLMAKDRSYTKMDLTGIGGRDSRGTSCDLANITVPGAQPNNYALTSSAVPNTPGALKAAATGPFGALNSITNAGSFNRCDTNSYASLFPREEQNTFFGQFHQQIMPGVQFSTKFLWSTRLDSAM